MAINRLAWASFTFICVLALATPAFSGIIKVKPDSPTDGPGNDWNHAYHRIADGLAAAAAGDEVWVAKGTYPEMITLKADVALYGGFAGNEISRNQRNWKSNETIIEAESDGSTVTSPAGATSTTRIDGFTITHTLAPDGYPQWWGVGVLCESSSPTITNNTIRDNIWIESGGGISCWSSSPVINNNTISGNLGAGGGGISLVYCSATVTYNRLVNNRAEGGDPGDGGGIGCYGDASLIANNKITGNAAAYGGGIYCWGSTLVCNNVISANTAAEGSAILCGSESGLPCRTVNNTIVGNNSYWGGAAVVSSYPSAVLTNNIIAFNSSGVWFRGDAGFKYNCVYGNAAYDYATDDYSDFAPDSTNISVDPRLEAHVYGKLHIQPGSPCIDAGDDSAASAEWSDMDGQPRTQRSRVDIGADETDGTVWSGEPTIIHVSEMGDDSNDGLSWRRAKRSVQAGIDAASITGGQVWVCRGVYYECVRLKPYVCLYGGYVGNKDARTQLRDSVLDAGGAATVVRSEYSGYQTSSSIDGFTIRNGGGFLGSGIWLWYATTDINNNSITGNTSSHGGGICSTTSQCTISNNTITQNRVVGDGRGGGIDAYGGTLRIINNTIAGNTSAHYGAIDLVSCQSTVLANNIIAFNSSGMWFEPESIKLSHNCVFGNGGNDYYWGGPSATDINMDPLFVAPQKGDYHLSPFSPCIDAGDDSLLQPWWLDIDGKPRIKGAHVDMGADEATVKDKAK